jgi:hypothetical protein
LDSQGIEGNDKISPLEGRLRGVKEIEIMSITSHLPLSLLKEGRNLIL